MYTPQVLPSTSLTELVAALQAELVRISSELGLGDQTGAGTRFLAAAPDKPREGLVVQADGTNWNPGSGKGTYQYINGVWVAQFFGGLPAGIGPIPYAGSVIPANFIDCNQPPVSRITYSRLYAAIGTTFGAGDGSTTFNLPPIAGRGLIGEGTATTTEVLASQTASSNAVVVGSNADKWITGMPVVVTNASGFTGLVNGSYWIIRVSATQVRFGTTLANAQNGTAMTVTGTGVATLTTTWTARTVAQMGGEESHALSSTELLLHTHTQNSHNHAQDPHTHTLGGTTQGGDGAGINLLIRRIQAGVILNFDPSCITSATATNQAATATNQNTGGNAAANNMQLYLAMKHIISI